MYSPSSSSFSSELLKIRPRKKREVGRRRRERAPQRSDFCQDFSLSQLTSPGLPPFLPVPLILPSSLLFFLPPFLPLPHPPFLPPVPALPLSPYPLSFPHSLQPPFLPSLAPSIPLPVSLLSSLTTFLFYPLSLIHFIFSLLQVPLSFFHLAK